MADTQATDLPVLTTLASADVLYVVDASDTTDDPEGSSKQITAANLATGLTSIGGLATDAEVTTAVSTHAAVTSGVHGISAFGATLVDDADASAARTTLGLVIGTNVQAQDAELAAIAGLTSAADRLPYFTGSGTAALATFTAAGRALVDDADADAQLATLAAVDRENGGLETVSSPTISAGALTLNLANGNVFTVAHNANITTLTLSGATSGRMCSLSLRLTQDGTGGRTITWPASVDWPSATAPTLTTTANAVNWIELWTVDGGTTWFGALSGAGFA